MRSPTSWLLASAAILPVATSGPAQAEPFRFHYDHVLGTSLDLTATAPDAVSALMAATAARHEIVRLDRILSAWRPDSEFERLNHAASAQVSPDLFRVLHLCERWRAVTGGAFDCRTGGALALWRQAEATGGAIDRALLDRTQACAGQTVGLDRKRLTVHRPEGMRLTIDGLAKGYVIDAAIAAARKASPNLRGLMIDIGGDLRCWGQAPQAGGWRVGVAGSGQDADNAAPAAALRLGDQALAFSGRGARDMTVDGRTVSHTLDPFTGRPAAHVERAVIVAKSAADADALATAFMVMPPKKAVALADRLDGVQALVTSSDGVRHRSSGWDQLVDNGLHPNLVRANLLTSAVAAAAGPAATQAISLDMTYQVPRIDAQPYHAPYVVMWLTDANHQMVRTLLVLGAKPKWSPENYVWWRRYGRLTPQVLDSVARPTRPPGRYTVHWDGKNDEGKAMAPGHYILHIEAAREKGGHTYQTIDLDLAGPGGTKALPAKDEMGAVDLRYGPAA